jgi:NAD(P)-dependent dehydrogenase (short-subunit alcohol dehydrogenase family)
MAVSDQAPQVLERLFDVRDRRVLVTGAASGIGFAFAEVLADCGARVLLADINAELLAESTEQLASRGLAVRGQELDVSDAGQVQAAVARLVEDEGGLDVVFANAGIAATPGFVVPGGQTLDAIAAEDLNAVMAVNFHGIMNTIGAAAGVMKRQGSGRIIVTSSNAGLRPEPFVCYGYAASKAAVIHVVRHAALELAPHGVLINAICPGPFKGTRIGGGVTLDPDAAAEKMWAKTVPLGRMATTEEIKGLALMLASPASSFITGTALVIDGGVVLGMPPEVVAADS